MSSLDLYPWFALGASAVATVLFAWHARYAVRWYMKHPDRAWASLLVSIVLVVIGIGMTVSSLGLFMDEMSAATVGLSIARGALLIGAVVLFLGDIRSR